MNAFRKLLTEQPKPENQRLKALVALTRVSPSQLIAMTDGLTWQPW